MDSFTRGRVVGLIEAGYTRRQAARAVNRSVGAVQAAFTAFRNNGRTSPLKRCGRFSKISPWKKRLLEFHVKRNRRITLPRLSVVSRLSIPTVRKALGSLGYFHCVALKKPLLSQANIEKGIMGVCDVSTPTIIWRDVIFSDESSFCLLDSKSHGMIWRKQGESLDPDCIQIP